MSQNGGQLIKAEVKQPCEECGDVTWVYWCGRHWLCNACVLGVVRRMDRIFGYDPEAV